MGTLDPEIESGITYMPNNGAETIAATLRKAIDNHRYERKIVQAALQTCAPQAVAPSLQNLLNQAMGLGMETTRKCAANLQLGSMGALMNHGGGKASNRHRQRSHFCQIS